MGTTAAALNGRWSSNWGEVRIQVQGSSITGTWQDGGLSGTFADGALAIDWNHRDGTTGKASLKADAKGEKLTGTWGFGAADKGEGEWTLNQIERIEIPAEKPADGDAGGDAPAGDTPAGDDGAAPAPADDSKKKKK